MEDYENEDPIGFGSSSTVYKAEQKNKKSNENPQVVAIKLVEIESYSEKKLEENETEFTTDSKILTNKLQRIEHEISLWKPLDHENLCQFLDILFLENQKVALVMEYADRGDLLTLMSDPNCFLTVKVIKDYFKQLCLAVHYLHCKDLIHGDIKLENVFLCGETVKLGDFGLTRFSWEVLGEFGTVEYAAPELLTRDTKADPFKADMWALGVVLYTLLFKEFPFDGKNSKIIKSKILNDEISFESEESETEGLDCERNLLLKILERLLNKKPELRPSIQEILQLPLFQL